MNLVYAQRQVSHWSLNLSALNANKKSQTETKTGINNLKADRNLKKKTKNFESEHNVC